ncbi:MAG: hypothetical protein CO090_08030 [Acidobacteria bacterium CG_4_9_14_3_um_filter_49_7]|nr:MAG: hypothetical protein CO090_08030 [Acidobacteria bacterium CG_4_9_14_3_um_filter_49_7]
MEMNPGNGLLINALISFLVFFISCVVGVKVIREKARGRARIPAISFAMIWFMFGGVYGSVAARTLAAYFEAYRLDQLLFYVDNFFGVMVAPAIMFFVLYFYIKNKNVVNILILFFFVVCIVWWIFDVRAGARRIEVSYWLSEWQMASEKVANFAKYVLYFPTVVAILSLNFMAGRGKSRATRYKVFLSSISITGATFLMMADLLGTSPFVGFAVRVGIMIFCVFGYLSYFPTQGIENWIRKAA